MNDPAPPTPVLTATDTNTEPATDTPGAARPLGGRRPDPTIVGRPVVRATIAGGGPMAGIGAIYRSSVGRKFVMALSGVAILGFVVAHLLGTLKIFLGPEETNAYGEALRDLGRDLVPRTHLLWVLRIGLLAAFVVHLHAAFSLDRRNRRARATTRSQRDFLAADYASRTMLWSGIIVGLFIVFHLADLTWGATNPGHVLGDPCANQVASFRNPAISLIYLAGTAALSLHLFHGLHSLFQSLGVAHPWLHRRARRRSAAVVAVTIGVGYASIPIAVLAGLLR